MELNKPLSVHMTHEEYEQYKKFLEVRKNKNNRVFWGSKKTKLYGSERVEYEIYSDEGVKIIADEFLNEHIEKLKEENDTINKVAGNYLKEIEQLKDKISMQEKTIAIFNSYDYSSFKKSWWRSLWS